MSQNATLAARQLIPSQKSALRLGVSYLSPVLPPPPSHLLPAGSAPSLHTLNSWLHVPEWTSTDPQLQLLLATPSLPDLVRLQCHGNMEVERDLLTLYQKKNNKGKNNLQFLQKASLLRELSSMSWSKLGDFCWWFPPFSPHCSFCIQSVQVGCAKGCQGAEMFAVEFRVKSSATSSATN